jgi:hypothetical protein
VPMPSPKRAARALRTPGLETIDALGERIELMRSMAAQAGRQDPLDVVFMPAGLDMFNTSSPDAVRVRDALDELAGIGVTWATVTLPGETRAELLGEIDRFGADVISAMLRS